MITLARRVVREACACVFLVRVLSLPPLGAEFFRLFTSLYFMNDQSGWRVFFYFNIFCVIYVTDAGVGVDGRIIQT